MHIRVRVSTASKQELQTFTYYMQIQILQTHIKYKLKIKKKINIPHLMSQMAPSNSPSEECSIRLQELKTIKNKQIKVGL
jgi:hypothetical protein